MAKRHDDGAEGAVVVGAHGGSADPRLGRNGWRPPGTPPFGKSGISPKFFEVLWQSRILNLSKFEFLRNFISQGAKNVK